MRVNRLTWSFHMRGGDWEAVKGVMKINVEGKKGDEDRRRDG